jgi:hypothetical protein
VLAPVAAANVAPVCRRSWNRRPERLQAAVARCQAVAAVCNEKGTVSPLGIGPLGYSTFGPLTRGEEPPYGEETTEGATTMGTESELGDPCGALADRMQQMEERVAGMGEEVRTRRLVVIDRQDDERIVGEVGPDGTSELRLDLPGRPRGKRTSVMLFGNPGTELFDLPPGVGIHLWLDGEPVEEFDIWLDDVE